MIDKSSQSKVLRNERELLATNNQHDDADVDFDFDENPRTTTTTNPRPKSNIRDSRSSMNLVLNEQLSQQQANKKESEINKRDKDNKSSNCFGNLKSLQLEVDSSSLELIKARFLSSSRSQERPSIGTNGKNCNHHHDGQTTNKLNTTHNKSINKVINQATADEMRWKTHRRTRSTYCNHQMQLLTLVILANILACVCDTNLSNTNNNHNDNQSATTSNKIISSHEAKDKVTTITANNNNIKHQRPLESRYKDKLIHFLSEEIERKHYQQMRPSKFDDNGQDIDFIQMPTSPMNHHTRGNRQKAAQSASPVTLDPYTQIMQMHQLQAPTSTTKSMMLNGDIISTSQSNTKNSKLSMKPVKAALSSLVGSASNIFGSVSSPENHNNNQFGATTTTTIKQPGTRFVSNIVTDFLAPLVPSRVKLSQLADPTTIELISKLSHINTNTKQQDQPLSSESLESSAAPSSSTINQSKMVIPFIGRSKSFKFELNPLKSLAANLASSSVPLARSLQNRIAKSANSSNLTNKSTFGFGVSGSGNQLLDPIESSESSASGLLATPLATSGGGNGNENYNNLVSNESGGGSVAVDVDGDSGTRQLQTASKWLKGSIGPLMQGSLRDILALTQLPIAPSAGGPYKPTSVQHPQNGGRPLSTAPSILESNSRHKLSANEIAKGSRILEELLRFAYIITSGVRTKRDPLIALGDSSTHSGTLDHHKPLIDGQLTTYSSSSFSQRSNNNHQLVPIKGAGGSSLSSFGSSAVDNSQKLLGYAQKVKSLLNYDHFTSSSNLLAALTGPAKAKPRGIMWEMATDPSLAVTVFHLLERASVAVPLGKYHSIYSYIENLKEEKNFSIMIMLIIIIINSAYVVFQILIIRHSSGFLLMPFVKLLRNPLAGMDFGRILPPRASHRSVDYEELAKRLDLVDKMLSRALRSTHREATFLTGR